MNEINPSDGIKTSARGFWLPGHPLLWLAGIGLVLLLLLPGWTLLLLAGLSAGWLVRGQWERRSRQ